ncbi:glycosyl transferase [Knoellia sp. S7-12]|uniref:glycosyl transferase n=1 Tax=Knoellia sp. S7-12 TaxID=3126698 RepID=UPI0033673121
MKWSLLLSIPVVLCALALAWVVSRRHGAGVEQRSNGFGDDRDGFRLQLIGYPTERVDEVLERLDAQIALNNARLRSSLPVASAEMVAGTATAADATEGVTRVPSIASADSVDRAAISADARTPAPVVRWGWVDLAVIAAYLGTALHVLRNLVGRMSTGYLSQGVQDHQAFEWYFGASAHNVATLSNPLFSDRQNFPDGVNLMANAAVTGLGIPLAPLTLATSAHVTFFVVELLGLAGTAAAWFWFFRRRGLGRTAAAVGGWFVGFAPAMVSHANGHPNFVALFLIPVIIDRTLRLAEGGRRIRDGVVLGLLVTWQVFIGEEPLLLAAVGMLIAGLILVAHRRIHLARALPGIGIGAALCLVIVAVPLWWQFAGRQSYTSIYHPPGGNDLAALWGRATRTFGADPWASAALSMNRTEENAFFGVPLWLLAALIVLALLRRPVVQALAAVVVITSWLSLGEEVLLRGQPTGIPSLWALFDELPVLENVLPTRFVMIAVPALAGLLAIGIDAAMKASPLGRDDAEELDLAAWPRFGGWIVTAAAVVALLPVLPTSLQVDPRPVVPTFFTGDAWRDWSHGGSILAVPPTDIVDARAFDWQLAADTMDFPIVEGYFVGPNGQPDRGGQYGAARRPLSLWLYDVNAANVVTPATEGQRLQFAQDLRAWRTDTVVLPMRAQTTALRDSLVTVLGEPVQVEDVLVWDVREFRS